MLRKLTGFLFPGESSLDVANKTGLSNGIACEFTQRAHIIFGLHFAAYFVSQSEGASMEHTTDFGEAGHAIHETGSKISSPYLSLFLVSLVHFVIMYAVMYTMVNGASDIYLNLNFVYMTGMMLAPMVVLMPLTMKMMYPNQKMNVAIALAMAVIFVAFYVFTRQQTFINDKEFVRSMIPHHSGAILMCREAVIRDPELKNLCSEIIESQIREVNQMKEILKRL